MTFMTANGITEIAFCDGRISTFCTHVPKHLPADQFFRPVSITLEQWKEHWAESRDGFKSEDLPRTYHYTTIEEYVEMNGIIHLMGLFGLELYPNLLETLGKVDLWKDLKELKNSAIQTHKSPELRALFDGAEERSGQRPSISPGLRNAEPSCGSSSKGKGKGDRGKLRPL